MGRRRSRACAIGACALGVTASGPACAHTAVFGLTGFPAMLLHPLVTPEQGLGLVAAALLVVEQVRPRLPVAMACLLAGLGASFVYLFVLPPFAGAAFAPLIATGLVAALVALAWRPPPPVVAVPVAAVGFAVGLSTLTEAQTLAHAAQLLAGTAIGSVTAFALIGLGWARLAGAWRNVAARIVCSWIVASVLLVLALVLFRPAG